MWLLLRLLCCCLALEAVTLAAPEPELRQAAEFGRLKLACPRGKGARSAVKGAQIDWYLNGQQKLLTKPAGTLRPEFFTDDSRLKLKSNRLVLRNIQLSDAGSYSCLISEAGPEQSPRWINYTVVVSEEQFYDFDLPEIDSQYMDGYECGWEDEEEMGNQTGEQTKPYFANKDELRRMQAVPLGDPVTICCHIKGSPAPEIQWLYNGRPLSESSHTVSHVEVGRYSLFVPSMRQYDNGNYTCVGRNGLGEVSHMTYLEANDAAVLVMPCIEEGYPLNVTAFIGENATFDCLGSWDWEMDLFWVFSENNTVHVRDLADMDRLNRQAINEKQDGGRFDISTKQRLVIHNVTLNDTGFYTCIAYNTLAKAHARAYLTVLEPLEEIPVPLAHSRITVILSVVFGVLVLAGIILVARFYGRMRLERRERERAVEKANAFHAMTKKVIIDHQNMLANGTIVAPTIRIERCKPSKEGSVMSAYELPVDPGWEIPRARLQLGKQLGEGAFGRVVRGALDGSAKPNSSVTVAVKMLKEGHTDAELMDLVSEMEVMKMIGRHVNIINLIGTCTQDGPLLVIVEFAPHGNLRSYLRERRHTTGYERAFDHETPTVRELTSFAYQVARGMEYLAAKKCIHRDLAARNILVGENKTLKIADFGLARDIQNNEYYRKVTDGRLPVKWMAPEALFERLYTTQSDVWSFGILLWEIFSMGGMPYPSIPNVEKLFSLLREGYRMERPPGCPQKLDDIMRQCWEYYPNLRPTFTELVEKLGTLLTSLAPQEYLDLGQPSPPDSGDSSHDVSVDSQFELFKSTAM
ncbi:fibroblast growth factor receptor 2-like isoform X1 [Amphibalanus amphitrite]|uniref:fibroblast growth factor receptor 2-like isoform X1 n=1 Tax=Amphibalanus amphitrite TaxID=1232801 RepID=UPI001C8FE060|nr:fibroblast growth factor receptor 2-like isoform X1 [Amphibalanus amphitrite]